MTAQTALRAAILGSLVGMSSCRLSPDSPKAGQVSSYSNAVDGSVKAVTLRVGAIRSGMLPGSVLGGEFDAFGSPVGEAWLAPEEISPQQQSRWQQILVDALRRAGVQAEVPPSSFATTAVGEPSLHATLRTMRCSLRHADGGPKAQASALVEWEMVDPASGEPFHRGTTLGECSSSGSVLEAQAEAFREAADRFLAQPQTASVMRSGGRALDARVSQLAPGARIEVPPVQNLPGASSIEAMLARSSCAVFSIRNPAGHGSGFFIRKDGLGLTSAHVVEGRRYWDALLCDGRMIRLRVLREDSALDLALVQASEGEFEVVPLGDSGALRLGEEIWTIGTPVSLHLSQSISRGIVSALRVEASRTLIQTDAALNPGSSGGPILNREGEVVGIVNLKIRASAVEGIGFCTAINDARAALLLIQKPYSESNSKLNR